MKRLLPLAAIFIICATQTISQPISQPIASRYPALGAYSLNHVDLYSSRNNAAALAEMKYISLGLYGERRFLQNNLNLYMGSIGGRINKVGNFAFHGSYYGFSLFNQMQLSLAYGLKITNKVNVGAQFNYHTLNQGKGYGSASSINASVGAIFHLTDKIHAGINVYNPLGSKWNKITDEKIPSQYTFGMGYEASDKLFISSEIVKEENQPVNVNAGIEYRFIKQLFGRIGVATATSNTFAAVGFLLPNFRVDISASYHPQLGFSPGILLLFDLDKKIYSEKQ